MSENCLVSFYPMADARPPMARLHFLDKHNTDLLFFSFLFSLIHIFSKLRVFGEMIQINL